MLKFPLTGQSNRPIYTADGRLVSITEHAEFFKDCANLVADIDMAKLGNVDHAIDYLTAIILKAQKIMEGQK